MLEILEDKIANRAHRFVLPDRQSDKLALGDIVEVEKISRLAFEILDKIVNVGKQRRRSASRRL